MMSAGLEEYLMEELEGTSWRDWMMFAGIEGVPHGGLG